MLDKKNSYSNLLQVKLTDKQEKMLIALCNIDQDSKSRMIRDLIINEYKDYFNTTGDLKHEHENNATFTRQ